jgi:hypothetical protein
VPFNARVGFVALTHERFIFTCNLQGNYLHLENTRLFGNSALLSILIDSDDEKVVILGISTSGGLEIHGALLRGVEVQKPRTLKIAKKVPFNRGMKYCACLKRPGEKELPKRPGEKELPKRPGEKELPKRPREMELHLTMLDRHSAKTLIFAINSLFTDVDSDL